jgi:isochorismate hydrolase
LIHLRDRSSARFSFAPSRRERILVAMTTLENRPRTALMVLDAQNGVVAEAYERERVIANIALLVERARSAGVPIVWAQHSDDHVPLGSEQWQIVSELQKNDSEPLVQKTYADAFEDTDLEDILAGLGVGRLVVAGAQTDECIRSTLHGAVVRGYDATLVGDAHTTEDLSEWGAPTPDLVIAHTNLYWDNHRAPGRSAGTVMTEDVDFSA